MIRIPTDADQNTRDAFLDAETDVNELKQRLAVLEERLDRRSPEDAPEPSTRQPGDYEVDGSLSVGEDLEALGNISLPHLYEGLIKVVPTGIGSDAQRVINVAASLAIAPGSISADTIRGRVLDVPFRMAMWKSDSESGGVPVWDTDTVNTDPILYTAESSDTQIHVNEGGVYLILVDFNLTLGAGVGANVDLQRNGSAIDGRCTVDNGDTTGAAAKSGSIAWLGPASSSDYWRVTRDAGTWQTNDVFNRFAIIKLA